MGQGGTGWNVLRNFARFWTVLWAVLAIQGMVTASQAVRPETEAARAGAAMGRSR